MTYTRIDAAFRSSKHKECFVFVDDRYAVLSYAPGSSNQKFVTGPAPIVSGFPILAGTPFADGINCTFETKHDEAFIFYENHCAEIDYAPHSTHNARILTGPTKIATMFPCLHGTIFEHRIDAAIRTIDKHVLLFKGDEYVLMDYHSDRILASYFIRTGFKTLAGTIFENGIDAAFKSDKNDAAYIFKDQFFACINIDQGPPIGGHLLGGRIKRIYNDWHALTDITLIP